MAGSWHLSLRADRPVEGCDVTALAYLYQKALKKRNGVPIEAERPPPPPKSEYELRVRWFRGSERPVCARIDCPIARNYSPLVWSMSARNGVGAVQCVDESIRRKLRLGSHTVFCGAPCFKEAWRQCSDKLTVPPPVEGGKSKDSGSGAAAAVGNKHGDPREGQGRRYSRPFVHDDGEWEEVCSERVFRPGPDDVGCCMRIECTAINLDGSVLFGPVTIRTEPVLASPPPPPRRPLVTVKDAGAGGGFRFRILTYNLLAEIYATQQMYPHCDLWALNWGYRVANLMRELGDAAADIMCLQEVQADHFKKQLKPLLSEQGFDGLFKQKTRADMGSKGKMDGCALFWRRSKFRLAEQYAIELNEIARAHVQALAESEEQEREMLSRLLKDNVAQFAVLEVLNPPPQRHRQQRDRSMMLCVANTHLYSNQQFPDVKLWQCQQLIAELEQLVVGHLAGRDLPLVLCGDFNSLPSSAVYDFLADRMVSPDHPDLAEDLAGILPHPSDITHAIDLESAYLTVCGTEPPYSNYTVGFKGTLDYLWHTPNHLRPLAVTAVPSEQQIAGVGGAMPNPQSSSDHIMLCVDMQLGGTLPVRPPVMGGGMGPGPMGAAAQQEMPPGRARWH